MSSELTSLVDTEETEPTKPKRLPRSAKKRLRYERLRQHYREVRKNKNKSQPSDSPSLVEQPITFDNGIIFVLFLDIDFCCFVLF